MQTLGKPGAVPPRHEVGKVGDFYEKGLRASDDRSKLYIRSNDSMWETPSQYARTHATEIERRRDFRKHLVAAEESRQEKKRVELTDKLADREQIKAYDPFGNRVTKQDPRMLTYETQQAAFEAAQTDSYTAKHFGKPGGGGALYRDDGSVEVNVRADPEVHLHNEYLSTQDSGSATQKYDPHDWATRPVYRKQLETQMADNAARRIIKRAEEEQVKAMDDGGIGAFGKIGAGAPNRNADGTIMVTCQGSLDAGSTKTEESIRHGRQLKAQVAEAEARKAAEKNEMRTSRYDHDVYGKDRRIVGDGERAGHVQYADQNGMRASGVEVPDSSLVNTMGAAGGGAPLPYKEGQRRVLPISIEDESYKIEERAQLDGTSDWGKEGGGGPLRNPDGSIVVNTGGRVERDKTGEADIRGDPKHQKRVAAIATIQREYLATKAQEREQAAAEDRAAEVYAGQTDWLPKDPTIEDKVFDGFMNGRNPKPAALDDPRLRPPPPRNDGSVLEVQIQDRASRRKAAQKESRALDVVHNKRMIEWYGGSHGDGLPRDANGHLTGKYSIDRDLHTMEISRKANQHMTPAEKATYGKELMDMQARQSSTRKKNTRRKLKEEQAHAATEAGQFKSYKRIVDGRRRVDPDDVEYKMLTKAVPNLA